MTLPNPENLRTPSKKRNTPNQNGSGSRTRVDFSPFTPKRLMFGIDSPFRTPSSGILDPYNPSTLIEEEVMRINSADNLHDSPGGSLFGKRNILYDSPGVPSPTRWERYW